MARNNTVFLDSSVLIAALLSAKGGSFYILDSYKDKFSFVTDEYVFGEVQEVIEKKLKRPDLRSSFLLTVGSVPVRIFPDARGAHFQTAKRTVNLKDAPILASALEHANYLLTLDHDFLNQKTKSCAESAGVSIYTPGEFIERVRSEGGI